MIERGATTMWERWDGIREDGTPFESLNHYSKGAVVSFLHRYVAGIRLLDDAPAYRRFCIEPQPGGPITWARARHDGPYGPIESAWRIDGGTLQLDITVPPGTAADVILPGRPAQTVPAGRHTFTAVAHPGG
jgi:alpha-L-rhamnosidase